MWLLLLDFIDLKKQLVNKSNTVKISCSDDQCPAAFVHLVSPKGCEVTYSKVS